MSNPQEIGNFYPLLNGKEKEGWTRTALVLAGITLFALSVGYFHENIFNPWFSEWQQGIEESR